MIFNRAMISKSSFHVSLLKCLVLGLVSIAVLISCASKGPYQIELMPPPEVYDTRISPFADEDTMKKRVPRAGILYATDRAPATEEDKKELVYANRRGYLVRLGRADIGFKNQDIDPVMIPEKIDGFLLFLFSLILLNDCIR